MPSDQTGYDIFISYARPDDAAPSGAQGWVTALRQHIFADHRRFSTAPLRIFLDESEIRDMEDWRHRILGARRTSKFCWCVCRRSTLRARTAAGNGRNTSRARSTC